jgi:hypothetical protein
VGFRVAREGHQDVKLYFDKESGLLVRTKNRHKDAMSGSDLEHEAIYSDYKEVSGVKVPMKVTVKRDGKRYVETKMVEVTLAEKLDPKSFEKPSTGFPATALSPGGDIDPPPGERADFPTSLELEHKALTGVVAQRAAGILAGDITELELTWQSCFQCTQLSP